jgi:holliday junction DNA helicase RuvA
VIAAVRGEIFEIKSDAVIVMAAGVGYVLFCSLATLAELQAKKQKQATLLAYTHVTDDALQLFGFLDGAEKAMFLSLLKVNGIGAKTAMNILSGSSLSQLQSMIEMGDVKQLSKLPKVGKKTAEQMILTLKGKLVLAEQAKSSGTSQVGSALINLGFRAQEVEKVLRQLPEGLSIEESIRQGLAALTSLA